MPAIEIIPALEIVADQYFIFYGKGIHLNDVLAEYNRLKEAIVDFQNEKELDKRIQKNDEQKLEVKKKSGFLKNTPRLLIPKYGKNVQTEYIENDGNSRSIEEIGGEQDD